MGCRHLATNSSFIFWHYWVAEPYHVDVELLKHQLRHLTSKLSVTQVDRSDRTLVMPEHFEACCFHGFSEQLCVFFQL